MWMLPLLALTACGPSETEITVIDPELVLIEETVDFGDVVVGESETHDLELVNAGRAPLDLQELSLLDGTVFEVLEGSPTTLEEDERGSIRLSFTPTTYLPYTDTLFLVTNDPDFEEGISIPLSGEGVDAPKPDIVVDPLNLDFGSVAPGDIETLYFTVENTGTDNLVIVATHQEGSGAFEVVSDPYGHTLSPNQDEATVVVLYTPSHSEGDSATFQITSNDPDEPIVDVLFLGNGGSDGVYPIALIEGPDEAHPLQLIDLDGESSYDPSGYAIESYTWTLSERPDDSQAELTEELTDESQLFLDIAGDYEVQLVVENELQVKSAPAVWRVDAIPDDAVHVELTWNTGSSDLDLHMLDGAGAEFFDQPDDCCYCNPGPSWGGSGTDDDPRLDLDDLSGYGPENINIRSPADGDYYIRVHYFSDDGNGTTEAKVRIYLNGALFSIHEKDLEFDQVWEVGYIRWPEAVVVEEETTPEKAESRACY